MAKLAKKDIFIFLGLLIIIAMIFWGGPHLTVGNEHPLANLKKRLILIALCFVLWLLHLGFILSSKTNKKIKDSEQIKKSEALAARFQGAIVFLKKTFINKHNNHISLSELPWYLCLGMSGSGKTTLLVNSGVNFILTKQFKQEKMSPSHTCDWWVTRDAVLVDIPGSFLQESESFLWDDFIQLLLKHRSAKGLKAITLALPFPEVVKNPPKWHHIFKEKIQQLQTQLGAHFSVYLIITKCDLLPGFSEFFNDNSLEELDQAWGITLPTLKADEQIADVFNHRFNALIKRLNEQLIYRLHHERNQTSRPAIKDFPLQIERLKVTITQFLQLLGMPTLNLHGVYLTSATQPTVSDPTLHQNSHHALQLVRYPIVSSKAYFIKQLILQGLQSNADPQAPIVIKHRWQKPLTYSASAATILITAALLGMDFQKGILQIYSIQNNLVQYQLSAQNTEANTDSLLKIIPLLTMLSKGSEIDTTQEAQLLQHIPSVYSDKTAKTAKHFYEQALQTLLIPEIQNHFENYLQNPTEKDPAKLYLILKAYLSFTKTIPLNNEFLLNALVQLLPKEISTQTYQNLLMHINHLSILKINTNQKLITDARRTLLNLTPEELAFVILKNKGNYGLASAIQFNSQTDLSMAFFKNNVAQEVPNLFTLSAFTPVLTDDILHAANAALRGNEVLGALTIQPNEATINDLINRLRTRYLKEYSETWERLISQLKLMTPNNLAQTDTLIVMLMSNSSPLLQLLQTIRDNTSFEPIMAGSHKIRALNNLLANAQSNDDNNLYQLFVTLRQLHMYLQSILNTDDVGKAAFISAKNRMQRQGPDRISQLHLLADQTPEPMRTWLHNLASQSWYFMLKETAKHIENAWQVNIMPIYRGQLVDRFPINPRSDQEVDLKQLASFVGKDGTLHLFYQSYLQPFIIDDGKQWHLRMMDNQKLPLNQAILLHLQQVSKLQKTF